METSQKVVIQRAGAESALAARVMATPWRNKVFAWQEQIAKLAMHRDQSTRRGVPGLDWRRNAIALRAEIKTGVEGLPAQIAGLPLASAAAPPIQDLSRALERMQERLAGLIGDEQQVVDGADGRAP